MVQVPLLFPYTHAQTIDHRKSRRMALWSVLGFAMTVAAAAWPGTSKAAEPKSGVHNIVLVHGAFSDGSSWQDVIPLLQAKGYHVTAVQNPLTSLADDVAATRKVLERQKGGVLLVGHSWAGVVITEAGTADNVKGLVYLSALVPDQGESAADMLQKRNSPMKGLTPDKDGLVWLDDAKAYAHVMAADVSPARIATLAATQQPIAARTFSDKVDAAAWTSKPSWYLVTEGDNAVPAPVQKWLAQHIGATTDTIKSSHMSLVSHPQKVASLIISAAKKLSK